MWVYGIASVWSRNFICFASSEVEREQGAFRALFGDVFEADLDDSAHLFLLGYVVLSCKELDCDTQSILSFMSEDDFEHALCEWVKATRGKVRCLLMMKP